MKRAKIILFFLVLSMPAMAAEEIPPVEYRWPADMRLLPSYFAALTEGHVEMVLHGLKIISSTEEAQSGEWEKMKRVLAAFEASGIKASAVWFVRTDGSYYTVAKGLVDQNISDRPYFQRLMAGEETTGDLVISRSTGKRSAVVAVPVKRDGRIIGGLGTSLDLEEMSRMLDEKMGLPQNMFFYALDQKGQTSLHRTSALLLAYPSDMGSKSLTETVKEMLARPEGVLTYDFYGERTVAFRKAPLTGWVFAIGLVTGRPGSETGLKRGTILCDDALRTLANSTEMKKVMSANDDAGIRKIFMDFYSEHEGLYSVQWIDSQGTNRYGYPEEKSLINFDMKTLKTASSKPILRALSDKKESTFDSPLVEGKTGTFFMVPVHEGGEYLGMVYTIRIKE